ncbi:MAG: TPM domain-containing protein [Taibaiella sp.]|nr:TPM domain-containing protein [Taibaiella sp.]
MGFLKRHTTSRGLLSEEDQVRITNAIAKAEITTSGEIRVYIENQCAAPSALDRAAEVFNKLEMHKTTLRNGVLIYVALQDHVAAIFGDEGIYRKTGGQQYWEEEFEVFRQHLSHGEVVEGIEHVVGDIGYSLAEYFPYVPGTDKNELPDEIVFGQDDKI